MIPCLSEVQDVQHETDKGMKPRLCPLLNVLFLNSVPSYWPAGAVAADTRSDSRDRSASENRHQ